MPQFIQAETRPGKAFQAGKTRFIPFAQSYRFTIPAGHGGFVWNRPVSILTIYPDGSEEVTPIRDATRRAQVAILAIGFFAVFLIGISNQRRK